MRIFGVLLFVGGFLLLFTVIFAPLGLIFMLLGLLAIIVGGRRRVVVNTVVQVATTAGANLHANVPGKPRLLQAFDSLLQPSNPTEAPAIHSETTPYDRARWEALVKYDPDIAAVAGKLAHLGPKWVDMFASDYLSLNDKNYLPEIADKIIKQARAEAEDAERRHEEARKQVEEDTALRQQMQRERQEETSRRSQARRAYFQKIQDDLRSFFLGLSKRDALAAALLILIVAAGFGAYYFYQRHSTYLAEVEHSKQQQRAAEVARREEQQRQEQLRAMETLRVQDEARRIAELRQPTEQTQREQAEAQKLSRQQHNTSPDAAADTDARTIESAAAKAHGGRQLRLRGVQTAGDFALQSFTDLSSDTGGEDLLKHDPARNSWTVLFTNGGESNLKDLVDAGAPIDIAAALIRQRNNAGSQRVSYGPPIPTPVLVSPPDNAQFNAFPRTTSLVWQPVPGAWNYKVEVQGRDERNMTWFNLPGLGSPLFVQGTILRFNFIGKQRGRWRVVAVDAAGNSGPPSHWREFNYLQ